METLAGLLRNVAPAIATSLLGPAGGLTVKFLGDKLLGDPKAPIDKVTEAVKAAPEQQLRDLNEQYKLETERLIAEQGQITDVLLAKINPKAASKIAILRMATRPWSVRWLVRALLLPFWITLCDIAITITNMVLRAFEASVQFDLLAATFLTADTVYLSMYEQYVDPAAMVILGYMTLRQVEKSGNPLKGIGQGIAKLFKR